MLFALIPAAPPRDRLTKALYTFQINIGDGLEAPVNSQHTFCWGRPASLIDWLNHLYPHASAIETHGRMTLASIRLSPPDAEGTILYLYTDDLRVLLANYRHVNKVRIPFRDDGWIRLNFSLQLDWDLNGADGLALSANKATGILMRNPADKVVWENFEAGSRLHFITICFKPEKLAALLKMKNSSLPAFDILAGFKGPQARAHFFHFNAVIRREVEHVFRDTRPQGAMGHAYLYFKACELIVLALEELERGRAPSDSGLRLSQANIRAVHAVAERIKANLNQRLSIDSLTATFKINRLKLFYGFNVVFGMSVGDYAKHQRMERAAELLRTTGLPLAAIAEAVGYAHQGNFSAAFKKTFGSSPQQYRTDLSS